MNLKDKVSLLYTVLILCARRGGHIVLLHMAELAVVICQSCYQHHWELSPWLHPNNKALSFYKHPEYAKCWPVWCSQVFPYDLSHKQVHYVRVELKHDKWIPFSQVYDDILQSVFMILSNHLYMCPFTILLFSWLMIIELLKSVVLWINIDKCCSPQPKSKISASRKLSLKVSGLTNHYLAL